MKKRIKGMILLILMGVFTMQIAVAADTSYVSGELNRSGSLVQYSYIRTHDYYGSITLVVDNMPAGYLRLGLRNMSAVGGPQFSNSLQWNTTGTKSWTDVKAGVKFAFQGRMQATSNPFADNIWGGTLIY